MLSKYQRTLREGFLSVPETPPPAPWRPIADRPHPVGGLLGIGFGVAPGTGHDLVMVVSVDGHGLFDAVSGEKTARDRDPDPDGATPDGSPDLSCPGLGPLAGTRVRIAGLFGGGLHTTAPDGWSVHVVSPEWPDHRVVLSKGGGMPPDGPHGERWWHVFNADYSELRAAGFSPSGRTLAVATSSDLTLWTRCATGTGGPADPPGGGP